MKLRTTHRCMWGRCEAYCPVGTARSTSAGWKLFLQDVDLYGELWVGGYLGQQVLCR
jgi:hypothetical protein